MEVLVIFLLGVIFYRALGLRPAWRTVVLIAVCLAMVSTVPASPLTWKPYRFFVGLASIWGILKAIDLHLGRYEGRELSFGAFVCFDLNPFSLVERKLEFEPRPSQQENLGQVTLGVLELGVGFFLIKCVWQLDFRTWSWLAEHCLKVPSFMLFVFGIADFGAGAWRICGGRARNPMESPALATTPADFWRRYNRLVGQFLYEDVFKPAGGRKAPVRATLMAFAVSGVMHEALFSIVLGRIQGYQLLFFGIHGLAVAATLRIRPKDWQKPLWIAGTFAFNLLTSGIFFLSMDQLTPFYERLE